MYMCTLQLEKNMPLMRQYSKCKYRLQPAGDWGFSTSIGTNKSFWEGESQMKRLGCLLENLNRTSAGDKSGLGSIATFDPWKIPLKTEWALLPAGVQESKRAHTNRMNREDQQKSHLKRKVRAFFQLLFLQVHPKREFRSYRNVFILDL